MNSYERTKRICKIIVLVFGILSINNIILTIRNYSYAYFEKNVKTGVKLKITTLDEMPVKSEPLIDKLKEKLTSNNSITDTDGTIYLSGTNDTINFNYVWYSGKLWRITSINSDGSIKLVTQDEITAMHWGANGTYKDSWIYQWLNEDFKDTLYNYENIIVTNSSWNATASSSTGTKIPETTMVTGDIGLLNSYEYAQAYKNANSRTNYLNIDYNCWLITPCNNSSVQFNNGVSNNCYSPGSDANGVRPSINLKSNIRIVVGGDGSKVNPYRINGDRKLGKEGELINTRVSGEYVKIDNKVYRIVGTESGTTKLTSVDFVRDDSGTILRKIFSSDINWGISSKNGHNNYWDYYLNNTWLTSELKNYITEGTYYLGQARYTSYKNAICSASNTTELTSSCEKTSSTWTGKVGLPRVGEMFSAQLADIQNGATSSDIALITPYGSTQMWYMSSFGDLRYYTPSKNSINARPSIYLKSTIKITGGDGMSESTAYTIGL